MTAYINLDVSQATIESEKSTVSPFYHTKAWMTKFDLAIKKIKVTKGHYVNKLDRIHQSCIASFKVTGHLVPDRKIFKGFYCIWAWQPSWSCDPDLMNKLLFDQTMEAPHIIWVQTAQQVRRRCCLTMLTTQTIDHCLSFKLPGAFSSGELITLIRKYLPLFLLKIIIKELTTTESKLVSIFGSLVSL